MFPTFDNSQVERVVEVIKAFLRKRLTLWLRCNNPNRIGIGGKKCGLLNNKFSDIQTELIRLKESEPGSPAFASA